MVKYTLDNIEGLVFEHSGITYKIYKKANQMKFLNIPKKNTFFTFTYWDDCVSYLNDGTYKVISQPERTIELW